MNDDLPPTVVPPRESSGETPPPPNGLQSFDTGGLQTEIRLPLQDLKNDLITATLPRMEFGGKAVPSLGGIPLLNRIGQGGMGAVYYGIHPRLATEVAVKVLPLNLAALRPEMVDRFFREARTAVKIRSPHIVGVLDVNREGHVFYIVMEFIMGVSAGGLLRQNSEHGVKLTESIALDICISATKGLADAHRMGVIHRDVKPDNILLPDTGGNAYDFHAARLGDLGIARGEEAGSTLTATAATMGTPGYMAPEQAMDAKSASKASDVFSMGATLYALLTGRAPFVDTTAMKVLMATANKPHEPLAGLRSDVSPAVAALVDRCLEKDPAKRYADASELLEALYQAQSPQPALAPTVVTPVPEAKPAEFPSEPSAGVPTKPSAAVHAAKPALARSPQGHARAPKPARARPEPAKASGSGPLVILALFVLLVAGGLAYYFATLQDADRPMAANMQVKPEPPAPAASTPVEPAKAMEATLDEPPVMEPPVVLAEPAKEPTHPAYPGPMEKPPDAKAAPEPVDPISDIAKLEERPHPRIIQNTESNLDPTKDKQGAFGNRADNFRRRSVIQYGGSKSTEAAVDAALRWLANHQEPDGHWDTVKFGGKQADVAITGLALLAFLGAGHTEVVGEYKDNVKRAVAWLVHIQSEDGKYYKQGETHGIGYHHAIASLAMAEAAGMGRVSNTVKSAQKAVEYSTEKHQQGEGDEKGAWRYGPNENPDLSVSTWFIMSLKSAKVAGLKVNPASFDGAIRFLDRVEEKDPLDGVNGGHRYGYTISGHATRTTAMGNLCRQFLGWKREDLQGGVAFFVSQGGLPEWGDNGSKVDLYYWYYGTLCTFQQGGDLWKRWNEALKITLCENQSKGGDEDGSWPPVGAYSEYWGRAGQTAMGALCLETYYRYEQLQR